MLTDEYRYKILNLVEAKPTLSQRELSRDLGVSLGKVNFCLQSLIRVGLIKANNFRDSQNKLSYMYLLTPSGVEAKTSITLRFLKAKIQEYEMLKVEIETLQIQVDDIRRSVVTNENEH
jgi:EPS-associated MarR family transcriptional regulator